MENTTRVPNPFGPDIVLDLPEGVKIKLYEFLGYENGRPVYRVVFE